ncbi:MAG TPA: helix-turn-helix domain-containing protein [Polyangiaceae bacterium]|nr:helix-turn-helix domain-containing protein [Polyangiaceae bacterium]
MGEEARRAEAAPGSDDETGAGRQVPDLPPILTVDELADFLRLNRKTVYEAVSHGDIPGVRRIGHTFRISRDAVLQWLRSQGGFGSRRRPGP